MNSIILTILKEDILEDKYQDSTECAISRSLCRAGRPDLIDVGLNIKSKDTGDYVVSRRNKNYADLADKVVGMYTYLDKPEHYTAIPVETFTHTLEWE